jgi:hypothetical protein
MSSLSGRHLPVRAVVSSAHCPKALNVGSDSSHGVHRVPFVDINTLRPLRAGRNQFWREAAKLHTCSALAVPPGFGGLLRKMLCRFVAPYSRPWGSFSFTAKTPKRICRFPERKTLRSVPLLGSLHTSHELPRFTVLRAFTSLLAAVRRTTLPRCSLLPVVRPQGITPPKSPLSACSVATTSCPMLPWAFSLTWFSKLDSLGAEALAEGQPP